MESHLHGHGTDGSCVCQAGERAVDQESLMPVGRSSSVQVPREARFLTRQVRQRGLTLPSGDTVDLWLATLRLDQEPAQSDLAILSRDESERVERMAAVPQRRFVGARASLRRLLAAYLNKQPGAIRFAYGPSGKPSLAGPAASTGLQFSVSHTRDLALIGFCGSVLGVDLEATRPIRDRERLESRFFSHAEVDWLGGLTVRERHSAFFGLWTIKEAYVKALGTGVAESFKTFEVVCPPRLEVAVRSRDGALDESYAIRCIEPRRGVVAAVAKQGRLDSLHCWKLG